MRGGPSPADALSGWEDGVGAFGVVMTASFYEAQTQTTEEVILSLRHRLGLKQEH